jgi:hypothetical protein
MKGTLSTRSTKQLAILVDLNLNPQSEKLRKFEHFYTGYYMSDNEPDVIENATHNTFSK